MSVALDKDCYCQDTVQTDAAVQIDDPNRQSNITNSDTEQACEKLSDPIDDSKVKPDEDLHMEKKTLIMLSFLVFFLFLKKYLLLRPKKFVLVSRGIVLSLILISLDFVLILAL